MQERWLTGLFFIAGVLAGVLGMRLLGLRTSPSFAPAPPPQRIGAESFGLPAPDGDTATTNRALQQGLALGRLYQQFAQDAEAPNDRPTLPTIPAYHPPAPMGASLPPSQPIEPEPLQPLQPNQSGVQPAQCVAIETIPPQLFEALAAGSE